MLAVPEARIALDQLAETTRDDLLGIPGVRVSRRTLGGGWLVRAPADAVGAVEAIVGGAMLCDRHAPRDVDESRLSAKLLPWQREQALALARGEKRLLWASAGLGKSLAALSAADLAAPPPARVLIVTRALGRAVYARDSVMLPDRRRIAVLIGVGPIARRDSAKPRM